MSRRKEKLQISSMLKEGTEVESPNPGQHISVNRRVKRKQTWSRDETAWPA